MMKSISMPLSLVNKIMDESLVMKKDFSSTIVILLQWGLLKRAEDDEKEEHLIRSMGKE